jgi:hemerythrin
VSAERLRRLREALNELIYEHYIFNKRIDDMLNLLREEPLKAVIDFLSFFKNFLTPHFQREERRIPRNSGVDA